jgi:hypothetical protein
MIIIKSTNNLFPQPYKSPGSLNFGKPFSPAKKVISVLSVPKSNIDRQALLETIGDLTVQRLASVAERISYCAITGHNEESGYYFGEYGSYRFESGKTIVNFFENNLPIATLSEFGIRLRRYLKGNLYSGSLANKKDVLDCLQARAFNDVDKIHFNEGVQSGINTNEVIELSENPAELKQAILAYIDCIK